MAPVWGCEVCCEDFHDYTRIDIDGDSVCPACVRAMFDKAIKFEHEYPPTWSEPLHPSDFGHIFSVDYIKHYEHRELEYKIPPHKRIYCQHQVERGSVYSHGKFETTREPCGEFIGTRQKSSKADVLVLGRCKACKNATCMVCDDFSSEPAAMLQHICTGKSCANMKRALAFEGLKRGKDWQQCPNKRCGHRIELSEACNHIVCNCGTGFCFICGKEADGDADHWSRKNGCPRYNHPDDADAEYDDYDEDDDRSVADTDELGSDHDPLEDVRDLYENSGDLNSSGTVANLGTRPVLAHTIEEVQNGLNLEARLREHVEAETRRLQHELSQAIQIRHDVDGDSPESVRGLHETNTHVNNPEVAEPRTRQRAFPPHRPNFRASWVTPTDLVRGDEATRHRTDLGEQEPVTRVEEMGLIASNDAEAIANAYWEDDLSDEEHHAYGVLADADEVSVTTEEADIDRALWRMRVD